MLGNEACSRREFCLQDCGKFRQVSEIIPVTWCRKRFADAAINDGSLTSLATSHLELFGKRCRKLASLFTAVDQFSSLADVRL